MINKAEWEWLGNAGHFICGRWCRFNLCTKVGKYLVATVGEYVHTRHSGGGEQKEREWLDKNWPGEDIGCGRKYETMVFVAGKRCDSEECGYGMPVISGEEQDADVYNRRGDAAKGHLAMCEKWANHKTNET